MPEEIRPSLSRRSVVRAGAWATPAVAIAVAAPAASASTPEPVDSYLVMWGLQFSDSEFDLSFKNSSAISTLTVTSLTIDVEYDWEAASYNYSPDGPQPSDPTDDDTWPPGYPGGSSESGGNNGQGSYIISESDTSTSVHFYNTSTYLLAPGEVLADANGDGLYTESDWSTGDSTVLSWVVKGPRDPGNPWDTGSGTWVSGQTYTATFTMNYTASVAPAGTTVTLSQVLTASWTA
ncbi:hypothetical protein HQQ81_07225 [Microbacteriaceae bacterium VKM Ac-2854]|nr:hypothetical protein [Microbacteriaceae bacterium VKM Ac-2854]